MNTRRQVKCGYCGKRLTLWIDRGKLAPPIRALVRLPNGIECCPSCMAERRQAAAIQDQERDKKRRERAERRHVRPSVRLAA